MLVCALTMQTRTQKAVIVTAMEPSNAHVEREKFWFLKSNNSGLSSSESPYHTVHSVHSSTVSPGLRSTGGSDTRLDILPAMKSTRSNSWTEVGQEEAVNTTGGSELETVAHGEIRWGLLDPSLSDLYSAALASYCELLHSWGLMEKRTEVAKHGPGQGLRLFWRHRDPRGLGCQDAGPRGPAAEVQDCVDTHRTGHGGLVA